MALTHIERKGLLMSRGYSQRDLARELECSHALVNLVVAGRPGSYVHGEKGQEIAQRVCEIIGRSHDEVFGPVAMPSGAPLGDTLLAAGAAE